jgi:hypothetical protein
MVLAPSMVANDLNVARCRLTVSPLEANSPAIVDPDAVLAHPITDQRFEAVTRQHHECSLVWCGVQDFQLLVCLARERLELADSFTSSKPSRALVPIFANAEQEAPIVVRHGQIIPGVTLYVKRNNANGVRNVFREFEPVLSCTRR